MRTCSTGDSACTQSVIHSFGPTRGGHDLTVGSMRMVGGEEGVQQSSPLMYGGANKQGGAG